MKLVFGMMQQADTRALKLKKAPEGWTKINVDAALRCDGCFVSVLLFKI